MRACIALAAVQKAGDALVCTMQHKVGQGQISQCSVRIPGHWAFSIAVFLHHNAAPGMVS